jgi:LysM repeat protein
MERAISLKKKFFSIVLILIIVIIVFIIGLQTKSNLPNTHYFEYKTKLGDTCEKIAHTFNVSIASITKLNNLPANCIEIKPDQILMLPYPNFRPGIVSVTRCPHIDCVTEIYTVKKEETLFDIAEKFQTSEEVIINFNGLTNGISAGMKLTIPVGGCNPFVCANK